MSVSSLTHRSIARPRVTLENKKVRKNFLSQARFKTATTMDRSRIVLAMAKPEKGSRPSADTLAANPNATVDGQIWVCQGCGYVYDGTKGPWAEEKKCPACGERRFALKSRDEMKTAIGGLIVSVILVGLLFLIPNL